MPSPTRRTLTGTFQTPDGTPAVGKTVTFQLLSTLTDGNDNVIVATEKITATLDNAGALSVSLVSDSGDVAPQPVYFVRELFGDTRGYSIVIPAGSGSVDLSDLAPVGPSPIPPSAYALLSVMEAADAAVLAAAEAYTDTHGGGGGGAVASVNGHTGVVVLGASDVGADASGAATAAQAAAVATAATDATTKANAAQSAATAAAATDATTKANAAQAAAIAASQPVDSDLTAIAALSTTAYGRAFLALADAAAGRTALGLGTAATQASTAFDAAGAASTAQAAAIAAAATDATTKANAAQAASQPLDSDLTAIAALSTTTYGRSLLAAVDAAALRTLAGLGNVDNTADASKPVSTAQAAADAAVVASSAQRASNLSDLASASTARTNLGLGTAATHPVGDFAQTASNLSDLASASTARTNLGLGSVATHAASEFLTPLTPTATKTAAYTAAVGDLAMMNVAGGATPLTLPSGVADKSILGFRAIGATAAVPLVVNAGGSDTIGTAGATTTSISLADEETFLQYQASATRWLAISNVKTQTSLDGRYLLLSTVTTKGDLLAATAASTVARVGVGSDGQVLTADSASTPGVKWAAPASFGGWISGRYVSPNQRYGGSGLTTVNGTAYATPVVVSAALTLDRIACYVSTLSAGSTVRLGVYSDSAGKPANLLVDAGTVSGASTGVQAATVSLTLQPWTVYWFVEVPNGGTPALLRNENPTTAFSPGTTNVAGVTAPSGYTTTMGTIAALPSTWGSTYSETVSPMAFIRAA